MNIGLIYVKHETILELHSSYLNNELKPAIEEINYFETNTIDFRNNEFQLRYLKNVRSFSDKLDFCLGYEILSRFLRYKLVQESVFFNRESKRERSVYADLSIIGRIEYSTDKFDIQYDLGFGIIRYFKALGGEYYYGDKLFGFGANLFTQLQSDLSFIFWVSDKTAIKSEYSFSYESEDVYLGAKHLEHAVLVGGVFKLW